MTRDEALSEAMKRWPYADSWFASEMPANSVLPAFSVGYKFKGDRYASSTVEFRGSTFERALARATDDGRDMHDDEDDDE